MPDGNDTSILCCSFDLSTDLACEMAGVAIEVQDGPVVQAVKFLRAYWLLLLPAFLVCRFIYYRNASPLKRYPGPFLASGSRAWKVWSTYNGKTETDHIELHEKYGLHLRNP